MTRDGRPDDEVLETLDLISKKWHPVIVQRLLEESPLRFNELEDRIPDVSAKVLSDSLDDLVENDLVERRVMSESPRRVEYELTPHGRDLQTVIRALADWGDRNLGEDARPKVLVVDDDPRLAKMHADWLAGTYRVERAHGGREALEALDDHVDVVLLDRRMPDVSGDEVLRWIRERDPDCRVVMLTAVDPDFDVVDMEFDAYLSKPVVRTELEEVVGDVLSRAAHDRKVVTYLSLVAKRSLLRAEMTDAELDASDRYARLEERIAELEADLDDPIEVATTNEAVREIVDQNQTP